MPVWPELFGGCYTVIHRVIEIQDGDIMNDHCHHLHHHHSYYCSFYSVRQVSTSEESRQQESLSLRPHALIWHAALTGHAPLACASQTMAS